MADTIAALDAVAADLGGALEVDGPALLRERARILGIEPHGTVSAGGTCRLLPARDGRWVVLNLARRDDLELLAAWMEREWDGAPWDAVGAHLATVDAAAAVERAQLLGIPAAVAVDPVEAGARPPVVVKPGAEAGCAAVAAGAAPLVVDLSALWAGPLCTRLLAGRGARVVKVELAGRPDGARAGAPEFWRLLNQAKEMRTVDLADPAGRGALADLLDGAAVVVTAARPRALAHLDLGLRQRVQERGLVWVSITGYGFVGPWSDRVAFGDDAAVAGGLAVAAGGPDHPVFVGDAVADPLAGLHAAGAVQAYLGGERGAFLDVSMRDAVRDALVRGPGTLPRTG